METLIWCIVRDSLAQAGGGWAFTLLYDPVNHSEQGAKMAKASRVSKTW